MSFQGLKLWPLTCSITGMTPILTDEKTVTGKPIYKACTRWDDETGEPETWVYGTLEELSKYWY